MPDRLRLALVCLDPHRRSDWNAAAHVCQEVADVLRVAPSHVEPAGEALTRTPRAVAAGVARPGAAPLLRPVRGASALEEANQLLSEQLVDAALLWEHPTGPCLRPLRNGFLLDALPERPLALLAREDLADELEATILAGDETVASWGLERDWVLCDLPGALGLDRAAQRLRSRGLTLTGPLAPERTLAQAGAIWVAVTRDQAVLLPRVLGSAPECAYVVQAPLAWVPPATPPAAVRLAIERLDRAARQRGPLVAALERTRIGSLRPRAGASQAHDRCPFCHQPLGDTPDGSSDPAGPPVRCAECQTAHHRDCLAEHGACTVLGCDATAVLRLGIRYPIESLGEEDARQTPFVLREGDPALGPVWLRVEAPIDDPTRIPRVRALALELPQLSAGKGTPLEGTIRIDTPRPLRVRGGRLRLSTVLTSEDLERRTTRARPILDREAVFAGETPASALGRLQDGFVHLLGGRGGLEVPAGVRRYPFRLDLHKLHPASVSHRRGQVQETVVTYLEAELDTDRCRVEIQVG